MSRLGPRSSIVAGLLVGVATAVVLLAGVVAFIPDPVETTPTEPPPSESPPSAQATSQPEPGASPSVASSYVPASPSIAVSPDASAPFHVGEPAPLLLVPQVGGGIIDLASMRGKAVWVNFMATWCPPCQDELPLMNGFYARYLDEGLIVVAIDVKEEEGLVAAFAQRLNVTFPLGLDADGRVAETWAAVALPVHFWIDAEGIVRDGSLGGIGPDVMAAGLRSIMPGVDIQP